MDFILIMESEPAGPEMIPLWGDLPPDLVNHVTEFLPLSAASRFLCVSQEWEEMLYPKETRVRPGNPVVECVALYGDIGDLNCRLPPDLVLSTYHIEFPQGHEGLYPTSASGGLICFEEIHVGSEQPPTLFVCNPITQMWRQLPEVQFGEEDEDVYHFRGWFLAVDESSNYYTVWGINDSLDRCVLYDSRTMLWEQVRGPYSDLLQRNGPGDMVFYEGAIMHFKSSRDNDGHRHDSSQISLDVDTYSYRPTYFYEYLPSCDTSKVIEHHGSLFFVGVDTNIRTCYVYMLDHDDDGYDYREWHLLSETVLDWLTRPCTVDAQGLNNYICIELRSNDTEPCLEVAAYHLYTKSWSRWSSDTLPRFGLGFALKFSESIET